MIKSIIFTIIFCFSIQANILGKRSQGSFNAPSAKFIKIDKGQEIDQFLHNYELFLTHKDENYFSQASKFVVGLPKLIDKISTLSPEEISRILQASLDIEKINIGKKQNMAAIESSIYVFKSIGKLVRKVHKTNLGYDLSWCMTEADFLVEYLSYKLRAKQWKKLSKHSEPTGLITPSQQKCLGEMILLGSRILNSYHNSKLQKKLKVKGEYFQRLKKEQTYLLKILSEQQQLPSSDEVITSAQQSSELDEPPAIAEESLDERSEETDLQPASLILANENIQPAQALPTPRNVHFPEQLVTAPILRRSPAGIMKKHAEARLFLVDEYLADDLQRSEHIIEKFLNAILASCEAAAGDRVLAAQLLGVVADFIVYNRDGGNLKKATNRWHLILAYGIYIDALKISPNHPSITDSKRKIAQNMLSLNNTAKLLDKSALEESHDDLPTSQLACAFLAGRLEELFSHLLTKPELFARVMEKLADYLSERILSKNLCTDAANCQRAFLREWQK